MPRKIHHDQQHHRWVRTNTYYGHLWINYVYKTGYHGVPYAPSWRDKYKKPTLIHKGKKP